MVALTENRSTQQLSPPDLRSGLLGANQNIFSGGIMMRNVAGHIIKGATAVGSFGVGRSEAPGVSTTLGVTPHPFREGVFRYANSSAGDLIATANIGAVCYIVDDQTVALTNGTNTRSPAGIIYDVDALGVWVKFDEALVRAALS